VNLLLGFVGAIALLIDGGYAMAAEISSPGAAAPTLSPVDPRGILSLGLLGLSFCITAWLIVRGGQFPRGISYLGYVAAIDMVYLFIARLIIVNPGYLSIIVPALALWFLILPGWFIWLGIDLMRGLVDEKFLTTMKQQQGLASN
jgi:hypothetical protein